MTCRQAQQPSLSTRDLTIRFGGHVAVNAVTADFYPGTLTVIVGPNGAGKTTYFNLVSGQLPATSGSVLLKGADVTRARRRAPHAPGHRPRVPADQPVPQPDGDGKRAPGRAEPRRLGMNMFSVWFGHKELIERAGHYLERVAMRASATPTSARSRTATSASWKWRSCWRWNPTS
jgi:branched-chain amino acid transport system ATP-binding protein